MKKIFFIAATAALALSSCSSDEQLVENAQSATDGAVVFSANTLRNTRAYANWGDPIADATDLQTARGFGVFGYEHGEKDYETFSASSSAPNFFYNQNVISDDGTNWKYEPLKYYSNNKDAKHSFFAYAPFQEDVNNVFTLGSAPSIKYSSKENYDLMWAKPYVDILKPAIDETLTFNFQHALAKVDIEVAPFVDEVHGTAHNHTDHTLSKTLDENTIIKVRSVKFVGVVASQGLLNLEDGSWTYLATEESAYEINKPVQLDNTQVNDGKQEYQTITTNKMVIPTNVGDGVKIQVVYDVITTDGSNSVNNSKVTNTITSKDAYKLAAGKAYKFHLDLGMTTVKFDATVTDWDKTGGNTNVDLPNNHEFHRIGAYTSISAITDVNTASIHEVDTNPTANMTTDDYYYYNGKLFKASSATEKAVATAGAYYKEATGDVYVVGDAGACVKNPSPILLDITGKKYYSAGAWGTPVEMTYLGQIYSLTINSKGEIQTGAATWTTAPTDNNHYYYYDGVLYQWKGTTH